MTERNLYLPALTYKQPFQKEKLLKLSIERTVAGNKLKKNIPVFDAANTCAELLFYCADEAKSAFQKLQILESDWQKEFKDTLETTLVKLYQSTIDGRTDNNHNFSQDAAGFEQTIKYFVRRFCANPLARKNMTMLCESASWLPRN